MKRRLFPILALAAMTLASCAQTNAIFQSSNHSNVTSGRTLFLKNCEHCHGADARGDEGPDLHNLDWTDGQIINRICNGKKGQMTAFAGKLSADQINWIKDYLRTLK
jgi:mono/diheme cytochrome c family protein